MNLSFLFASFGHEVHQVFIRKGFIKNMKHNAGGFSKYLKNIFQVNIFIVNPLLSSPPLQLQHSTGREQCRGEGHQQYHGGPVLQDQARPGRDVEQRGGRHRGPRHLPPLLPGCGVSL